MATSVEKKSVIHRWESTVHLALESNKAAGIGGNARWALDFVTVKFFIWLAFLLLPTAALAQPSLPPCPSDIGARWENCFGAYTFPNGDRYVGEWRDDKWNGRGVAYRANGAIYRSGRWLDGRLVAPAALDPASFPFAGRIPVGPIDSGKTEKDQVTAEANVTQRRQQELELQVSSEAMQRERLASEKAESDKKTAEEVARRRQEKLEQERQQADQQQRADERRAVEARAEQDRVSAMFDAESKRLKELEARLTKQAQLAASREEQERQQAEQRQQADERRAAQAKAEQDRISAEVEAERRKRRILEAQLASEQREREKLQDEARERERRAAEFEAARIRQKELEQRLVVEAQERERQAAEAENARRKQQELEAQLAVLQSQTASRPPGHAALSRHQRRVALVIGNAQYKISPLENPVNDATDVDQTLKQLGFQTTLVRNATLGQMREATRRFAEQLQSADVALIYFAGHGIESNRKNFMIPVNADLKFEYELADQAYDAGNWLDMLESIKSSNAERVNIVILDACRNNSLIGARSFGRGLGRMDAPTGTFLAYSTAPGKVAADGARGQRNSPFTRHLLTVIQQPGLPIEEAFKEVRRNVSRETNGAQVPWESTSLTGFFTFRQLR